MMIASVRRNLARLISNPNSNNVCEPPLCSPLYFKNLSTSSENQPCINHKLSHILVHDHNFDPEFVSRVASKLPHVKKAENAGLLLSFLRESGFPDYRLEIIVSHRPGLLSASLEDSIRPKIGFFQEMGLSSDDISKMMSSHPDILCLSLNDNIIPSVALLKGLLESNVAVARVVRWSPRILQVNLENNVLPNVEFLKSCGVPLRRIRIVMSAYPSAFTCKPEVMKKSVEKVKEMGIDANSESFIYAVPTIAMMSNESWELKLQAFRSLGFSESDIAIMFRKAPRAFTVSMEKMKRIKELLLDTKKYTMSSIVDCPKSLQFSIEKRYVPRLQILRILESRSLMKEWPSLSVVTSLSDHTFFKKFVSPYSDKVSDVCSIQNSAIVVGDETRSFYYLSVSS